jgi:hypothetical protein
MLARLFPPTMTKGFRRMGRGIEERYRRCNRWWEPHLRCSRDFISRYLPSEGRLAVLGAGRLLDIDLLQPRIRGLEVHLFDADPACLPAWRDFFANDLGRNVHPHIADITNCLSEWSGGLRRGVKKIGLESYLDSCRAPIPRWSRERFDMIISLNVLGQLPLYWRDHVRECCGELNDQEEDALLRSMARLQEQHVAGLKSSPAARILALFDSEYYFYQSSQSEWRVEESLFGDSHAEISSCDLGRVLVAQESWLWHLAPQFVEHDDEGEIHRVEARIWG